MTVLHETVEVARPVEDVFAYISDFTTTEEWDATATSARKLSPGAIAVGTQFEVVCALPVGSVTLLYTMEKLQDNALIVLNGRCAFFEVRDTITLSRTATGTLIDYQAEFRFKPLVSSLAARSSKGMQNMGRESVAGLAQALEDKFQLKEPSRFTRAADRLVLPGVMMFSRMGYTRGRKHFNPMSASVKNKHMLITGASSGLGYAAALELARRGAALTLVMRDRRKAESTVAEIQNRLLNGAPDWALLPSDTGADLQELIERCVEKRPDRRPESMASILRVLDGLRSETRRRLPSRSDPARNQLPRPRTPFIGRDEAVASCLGRLERPGLLTIVGIGGIGKSRLALAVATRWLERKQGPVYFADLTPLPNEPAELEAGIAALLGVRDRPNQTTLDGIAEALVESGTLLVLDNCEQASAALIGVITRVRETLPDLRVLVTSRIPFSGSDDEVLRLDPLSVPTDADLDDPERLRNNDAVRLFLHHIHRIRPALEILDSGLTSIGVISRRVGGLPLALELAAARTRVLGLHEIEERLDEQLNFLREGGPASGPRRTLGVTIEWSADQLSARERRLFQALSVFTPSCDLEGLSAVSPDPLDEFQILDVVAGLSQKSLLQVESVPGGASRYRLLEPIRQFARKELSETGEDEDVRRRHANHFLALAERAEVALYGASQAEWLERLERDRDNLALALSYWAEQGDGRLRAARMVAALYRFWTVRGHIQEGLKWTQRILSLPEDASLLLRARVTFAHAFLLFYAYGTNRDTLAARFEDALALFRNAGDRQGMARCLSALGIEFNSLGDHERGMHALTEAREHYAAVGDFRGLATVANNMGLSHWLRHDVAQATPLIEESYRLHAQSGDRQARANAALNLAFLIIRAVDLERGRVLVEECADILRNLEDQGTTRAGLLLCTAELATREGDSRAAVWFFGAADARLAEIDLELTDLDPWWYEHDLRYAEARMSLGAGDGAVVDVSVDLEVGADTHVNADAELGVDPEVGADNEADVLYEAGRDSRPEETVRQILTWLSSPESPSPPTTLR